MKIFCIGLSKTGTTSLANALKMLGYRTLDNMSATRFAPGDIESIDLAAIEANDAFTDTPIPSFYQQLDGRYPGSRFILTVRDEAAWLKSCAKQFNQLSAERRSPAVNAIFEQLYQTTVFDEALFRNGYRRFIDAAKAYFADRPGDLLIMDVTVGDGWERLCPFLDRPRPALPFPKANVTRLARTPPEDLIAVAETSGEQILDVLCAFHGIPAPVRGACRPCSPRQRARWLLRKLRYRARRVPRQAAAEAARESLRSIEQGLARLTPGILVLSPTAAAPPEREQAAANHFWLVEPLDGGEHFSDLQALSSVNIALIQDGSPIMGVVHTPVLGVSYCSVAGKGATKAIGGVSLSGDASDHQADPAVWFGQVMTRRERELAALLETAQASVRLGRGLRLCLEGLALPRSGSRSGPRMADSDEWHTAAAHAVLKAFGRNLVDAGTGIELSYGKHGLANPPLEIR